MYAAGAGERSGGEVPVERCQEMRRGGSGAAHHHVLVRHITVHLGDRYSQRQITLSCTAKAPANEWLTNTV